MLSAHRAGSRTGGAGLESSPISHLSETMRALLDTSQSRRRRLLSFHIQNWEWGGLGAGRGQGESGTCWGHRLPCPLLPPSSPPPPF